MPLAELVTLLRAEQFDGFISLEWEKLWHPYLPPLRDALVRLQQRNWFSSRRNVRWPPRQPRVQGLPQWRLRPAASAEPYAWWRNAAESLLKPLAALMAPNKADLPLRGQASNHGAPADRLESFARPCLLAAHWLASEPSAREELSRRELAAVVPARAAALAPTLPAPSTGGRPPITTSTPSKWRR